MKEGSVSVDAKIVLVCQDLIFSTKIKGTAQALGLPLAVVGSTAAVAATSLAPDLVIVDLSSPPTTSEDDLRSLRERLGEAARLIAYGSHVEVERLGAARRAGCDPVLARSEFTARLPALLQGLVE